MPEILISWAQINPSFRFPRLASVIIPFKESPDKTRVEWTPLALQILDSAPDRMAVLSEFGSHFRPNSWGGSLADILERRRILLRAFLSDADPKVIAWAWGEDTKLVRMIEFERLNERQRDESFE